MQSWSTCICTYAYVHAHAGMVNMSHSVDSMSFGKMLSSAQQRLLPSEVAQGWCAIYIYKTHQ